MKKLDKAHSVIDFDCEGEVTLRYSVVVPKSDEKKTCCTIPNETIKNVAKVLPKVLCDTDTDSADV